MAISKKEKQPKDVSDFDVTFPDFFAMHQNDYITDVPTLTVTGTGVAPALVLGPGTHPTFQIIGSPAKTIRVWAGDGVDKVTYKIEGAMKTFENREQEFEFNVKVKDL